MASAEEETKVFKKLDADETSVDTIESLCLNCEKQGITRILITSIPYFKDVVVMAFECPHCGARNSEVQPANEVALRGVKITLKVNPQDPVATKKDLNRQVIKSESATLRIPEIDFEIPPSSKRGDINTVEGILNVIAENLEGKAGSLDNYGEGTINPEYADLKAKLLAIAATFRRFIAGQEPFTFIIDDPSGNSFLENPDAPHRDLRAKQDFYLRTPEMDRQLGLQTQELTEEQKQQLKAAMDVEKQQQVIGSISVSKASSKRLETYFDVSNRACIIPGACPNCHRDCETRMCVTDIPHFKEIIIMVSQCDECGFRDSEVKPGGKISEVGVKITLRVESPADLKRDVMKSDSCGIAIPELELEMMSGTLGGKYTTIEGLLSDIKEQLERGNIFLLGDSSRYSSASGEEEKQRTKFEEFMAKYTSFQAVEQPFTLIFDDPLANSYVYSEFGPEKDPQLKIEKYERTFEQNEEYGLNDINTENYLTPEQELQLQQELAKERLQEVITEAVTSSSAKKDDDEEDEDDNEERLKQLHESVGKNKSDVYVPGFGKQGGLIKQQDHEFD